MSNALRAPSTRLIGLGRGKIYFNPQDATTGILKGFFPLGNTKKLVISTTPNTTEVTDYTSEASAPYAQFITRPISRSRSRAYEQSEDNVALATLGDRTTLTQAPRPSRRGARRRARSSTSRAACSDGEAEDQRGRGPAGRHGPRPRHRLRRRGCGARFIRILETSPTYVDGTNVTIDYTARRAHGRRVGLAVVRGATKGGDQGLADVHPGQHQRAEARAPHLELLAAAGWRERRSQRRRHHVKLKGSILSDAAGAYGGSVANPFYQKVNRVTAGPAAGRDTCRKSFMLGGRGFEAAAEGTTFEQDAYLMGLVLEHGIDKVIADGWRRPAPCCVPAARRHSSPGSSRDVDEPSGRRRRPRERAPLRASVTRRRRTPAECLRGLVKGFFEAGAASSTASKTLRRPRLRRRRRRRRPPVPCDAASARLGRWEGLCAALAHHYKVRVTDVGRWPMWEGLTAFRQLLREFPPAKE
jgi:hypothetical protein